MLARLQAKPRVLGTHSRHAAQCQRKQCWHRSFANAFSCAPSIFVAAASVACGVGIGSRLAGVDAGGRLPGRVPPGMRSAVRGGLKRRGICVE